MYTFFKVVTVKPPIVSQDKKIQDTGDALATKKKIGTHLLPPFYQGHLYKFYYTKHTFLPRTSLQIPSLDSNVQSLTKAIIFELFYYINGYFRV